MSRRSGQPVLVATASPCFDFASAGVVPFAVCAHAREFNGARPRAEPPASQGNQTYQIEGDASCTCAPVVMPVAVNHDRSTRPNSPWAKR